MNQTYYDEVGRPFVKTGEYRQPVSGESYLQYDSSGNQYQIKGIDPDKVCISNHYILRDELPFEDSDNVSNFKHIVTKMTEMYEEKNSDYGDSFHKLYERYGLQSAVVRLYDKMYRIENLATSTNKVKNESIRDTLMDLANYAIMTIMELDNNGCG